MVGSLPPTQQLNASIMLTLRNQADLTALLSRLYDPSSPDYRHFLSVEQFTEQFGPTLEDHRAAVEFAQANGLTVTDEPANRLLVPVRGTVAQIEKAFNVSMRVYQHPTEKRTFFSPDREPSLKLAVPVAHIAGLNNFSIPRPALTKAPSRQAVANAIGSGPNGQYIASDMRAAYYGGTALTGSGQAVGLFELDGYYLADVNLVFSNGGQSYGVPINNVLLDGATGDPLSGDDAEEVIDIVQAIGMAPGLSQLRVYIGNSNIFDPEGIFNAMAAENICKQLSVSWLWEPDDLTVDDSIFQEFAAQGQSIFAAAGDNGAYNPPYWATWFPVEDAYVTAVGGTTMITNGAGGPWSSETAWPASGGGPSPDGIAIPGWQTGVANSSNSASHTLRNVPDVAMEAETDNYNCLLGTCLGFGWGGTSFAAPRWAGFMALVNQQSVAAGRPPVGSINPAIYSIGKSSTYSSDFHDIIGGNDDCCNQPVWYNAVTGYDLVTGWGSPSGQNLIDALAGPAANGFTLTNSALTTSVSINQGSAGTVSITVNDQGGFSGSVNLTVSGLPSGVTATFGTNPTAGSSVLTLTTSSSATPGPAYVTVTGTSGAVTATTGFAVTVVAPSFTLSVPPISVITYVGSPATANITVNYRNGFSGGVNLTVSGLPPNVSASFSPNPTSGSTVLTLTTTSSPSVSLGCYLTITGTSGALTANTFLYLLVEPPLFVLSDSPGSLIISRGAPASSVITVTPYYGFTGTVDLTAPGLPSGLTASFNPPSTTGTSTLTLTAGSSAVAGESTVVIVGKSSGSPGTSITKIQLTVTDSRAASSVAMTSSANPSTAGQPTTFTATVSPSAATGTVHFTDGATTFATAPVVRGVASTSISTLTVGAHMIVATYDGDANYAATASAVLAQTVAVGAPSHLTAVAASASQINLSWRASQTGGVAYNVYMSLTSGSNTSTFNLLSFGGTKTSISITDLVPSVTYYFLVTASDPSYNESAPSNEASAKTLALSAPGSLTAAAASASQINLSWHASSASGVSYNVYSWATPGFAPSSSSLIASGISNITYSDTALAPSTTRYYLVTAVLFGVESAPTNQASATTAAALSCHIGYSLDTQWNTGFEAAITITNSGTTAINRWNLTWTWASGQKINQAWDAEYTQTGANASLTNETYDATIAPGATLRGIGFNASYSGTNPAPTAFYINGTRCR
jgi:hypothetical protein